MTFESVRLLKAFGAIRAVPLKGPTVCFEGLELPRWGENV